MAITSWIHAGIGDWTDPLNWSAGVPTATSTVLFSQPSTTFKVIQDEDASVQTVTFNSPNGTFFQSTTVTLTTEVFEFDAGTGRLNGTGVYETFQMNGGIVQFNNPLAFGTGQLNLDGGTLLASRSVKLASALDLNFTGDVTFAADGGQVFALTPESIAFAAELIDLHFGTAGNDGKVKFAPLQAPTFLGTAPFHIDVDFGTATFLTRNATKILNEADSITIDAGATMRVGSGAILRNVTNNGDWEGVDRVTQTFFLKNNGNISGTSELELHGKCVLKGTNDATGGLTGKNAIINFNSGEALGDGFVDLFNSSLKAIANSAVAQDVTLGGPDVTLNANGHVLDFSGNLTLNSGTVLNIGSAQGGTVILSGSMASGFRANDLVLNGGTFKTGGFNFGLYDLFSDLRSVKINVGTIDAAGVGVLSLNNLSGGGRIISLGQHTTAIITNADANTNFSGDFDFTIFGDNKFKGGFNITGPITFGAGEGSLDVAQSANFEETVVFNPSQASSNLRIGQSFAGLLDEWGAGQTIELAGFTGDINQAVLNYTSNAGNTSGTLTIQRQTIGFEVDFLGSYGDENFTLRKDPITNAVFVDFVPGGSSAPDHAAGFDSFGLV